MKVNNSAPGVLVSYEYENRSRQFDNPISTLLSSSFGRPRDVKTLFRMAEEAPPHVPWRVSSLPDTAFVVGHDRRRGGANNHPGEAAGEEDLHSSCESVVAGAAAGAGATFTTTAASSHNGTSFTVVGCTGWMHSSNTTLLAASSVVCGADSLCGSGVGAPCSSSGGSCSSRGSSRPSKMTSATIPSHISKILVAGRIFDESSSCDSALAAREQTEVLRAALREKEASVSGRQGLPRVLLQQEVTSPRTKDSNTSSSPLLFLAPAPPPPVDVVPCDRRGWKATPRLTRRYATGTLGQSPVPTIDKRLPRQEVETKLNDRCAAAAAAARTHPPANAFCEARHASRVPTRPRRTTYTPRPIWAVLRNRTLKATRQDPSIFRGKTHSELGNGTNVVVPETKQLTRWHILNRRVFGVREVPRSGTTIAFPEWVMFSGGVPPSGIDEHSRWALRLGRNRKEIPC